MAAHHPNYLEAIRRNIRLLSRATHGGLLYGGMHYFVSGVSPCIHHTFGHAKALASFLEQPPVKTNALERLPRDSVYGVKYFKDIRTWLLSQGDWRATFTGYDAEYKVKGTHPMGGALSLLWHAQAGPIFAATMNQYKLIEAPNMQSNARNYLIGGTPRIEWTQDEVVYSNLDDLDTDIACLMENGFCRFNVNTHLVDVNQHAPKQGEIPIEMNYTFSEQGVNITVERCYESAYLVLPIIASPEEMVKISEREACIKKDKGILYIACEAGYINVAPTDSDGRIFNPVPGFSLLPLQIMPESIGKKIQVAIYFR